MRAAADTLRVWDPLVRLFHWSLVATMATAYLADDQAAIHNAAGYVALALIGFRLLWGFVGGRHARFSDFVRGPGAVLAYVRSLASGHPERHIGHNPAGGAMILLLLAAVFVTAGSGALMVTDRFWGVGWIETLHEGAADAVLGLVVVHLLGVVVSSLLHRENLVRAMITGRKHG
ncbi:cytochrome b/b6 domain-containing protein [Caenispirillum bisanense]|uniref:Cytochrome b n=1 Tax=Caenispirillum bisanense TaxID=414052 RepID=A0A286GJR0_9PROT|nr:cytochrome b/b6 domain-containing protein [Caenispirillum bisanense]SOD95446.1 Cytochrome b [Caenispirillum bisanense]